MTDGNQCLDTDPADVESALLAVEAEMESSTTTNQGNEGENGEQTQDDHSPPFSLSEIMGAFARGADGDADLMIELLRGEHVYDHVENAHFRFKEHIWVPDESEQIICEVRDKIIPCYAYAADTMGNMATEAAQNGQLEAKEYYESKEEQIRRHILRLHSLHKKKEIVQLACTGDNSLAIKNASWDQHPFKFPLTRRNT